jgi:cyclic pyranopterin phosphate synthase
VSGLVDEYGRVATDLRVSLTDRCNLRCTYCMPAEGLDWLPSPTLLTDDEVVRLVDVAVRLLGVREVRFTGGEPLVRRGLVGIVRRTAQLTPRPELSLTTNGLGLCRLAGPLAEAGLDRVNVSLDTPSPDTFLALTRRDRWHDVVDGLAAADEIMVALQAEYLLKPAEEPRGSAPAELFTVDGGPATVGIIGSVSRPFCGDCDRVRLTADGQVRNCLFAREESDLRTALRAGATDEELADRWRAAMRTKRPGHGIDDVTFLQPGRPMSAIGG